MKTANKNTNFKNESELPAVIHPRQAAQYLGLNINSIYELCRSNKINAKKVGQRWIIPKRAFLNWLNSDQ